jgi:hypothetical protein
MPINHRYIKELNLLENEKMFCGEPVNSSSKFLIIGTFNPDEDSCLKTNNAEWFYGRKKNNLWRFLPRAMGGDSLHLTDYPEVTADNWKQFCIDQRIVFIDLIKSIDSDYPLLDFGDNEVEARISENLDNTTVFNIESAFNGITFEKVIYSLSWSDSKIKKMKRIRDRVNNSLLNTNCIDDLSQIKYPNSPARNNSYETWHNAVNN